MRTTPLRRTSRRAFLPSLAASALVLSAGLAAPAAAQSDGSTLVAGDASIVRVGGDLVLQGTILSARVGCAANRDVDVSIAGSVIATPRTDVAGEWTVPISAQEVPARVGIAVRAATLAGGEPCDAVSGTVDTLFAAPEVGRDVSGSARSDGILGRASSDRLSGGGGDDRVAGRGGDDEVAGGAGNDDLDGGPGADHLTGGPGDDTLHGGAGRDVLRGGPGNDLLVDARGATVVRTGAGHDTVEVHDGEGDDRVDCPPGSDAVVYADAGDRVAGDCGRPRLSAPPRSAGTSGPIGLDCFGLGNGGNSAFPADGLDITNVGIASFSVTVRWQKSFACPLGGDLRIDTQETTNNWVVRTSESVLSVYSSGGRFEDWNETLNYVDANLTKGWTNRPFMMPNQLMKVRAAFDYAFKGYVTPWREIRFQSDPATRLDFDVIGRRDGTFLTRSHPQGSLFGESQVRFAARDPDDPTSRFEDAITPGVACDGPPRTRFDKRKKASCAKPGADGVELSVDTYASESKNFCRSRPTPCQVPFIRGRDYELRMVVDNTWSSRTWGPVQRLTAG